MANLVEVLYHSRSHYAGKPFIHYNDQEVSHSHFCDEVTRMAAALAAMGAGNGSRIVLLANNRPEWLATFFAILATGATAVPVNPLLAPREILGIVEHCKPVALVVQSELLPLVAGTSGEIKRCVIGAPGPLSQWHQLVASTQPLTSHAPVEDTDTAIIFYTSGTTGKPKGVMLSHSAMQFDTEMFSAHLRMSPDDVSLVVGSMAFMLHLVLNALSCTRAGVTLVMLDRFKPEIAMRSVERFKVSLMMGVPTVYVMIINWLAQGNKADLSTVRWAFSAGAAFPAALYERARAVLGITVFDLWGLTECAPVTSYDPARDKEGRPDSCGRPLPGCEIRVVAGDDFMDLAVDEIGEVLMRSPANMTGYFENPEATKETIVNGWVRSGDLGKIDSDGLLYIVGRQKDLIIRAGCNVYPAEIEDALYLHAAVGECAVVGAPDETFGEVVKAFVVLREGMAASGEELKEHSRCHLADYKVPVEVCLVDALPKGPTGKILKRELREQL